MTEEGKSDVEEGFFFSSSVQRDEEGEKQNQ